jgi:aminoglycoside phosphotransferase
MHDRSVLGSADVSDERLAAMVAASRGVERVQLLTSHAEVAPYDLDALTTGGRFWVRGLARAGADEAPYAFFVKVVQSWARSPLFQFVPEQFRSAALEMMPWQSEPRVYRSDLAARLPAGLTMPRAYAVVDLDEESAALWLEGVDAIPTAWDVDQHAHAAYLLGRLAASPDVRPLARVGDVAGKRTVRAFAEGRLEHSVLPALRGDDLWNQPIVASTFDDRLREDLLRAADAVPDVVNELETLPLATSHGDACTRNLLVTATSADLVLIDFGYWGETPVGFDLRQLLLGEVQMGERPASCLPALEVACLPAYVRGLRAEGCDVPRDVVRRSLALSMLLFAGLPAIPFENLDSPPTPELERVAGERAASARFILDLLDETAAGSATFS